MDYHKPLFVVIVVLLLCMGSIILGRYTRQPSKIEQVEKTHKIENTHTDTKTTDNKTTDKNTNTNKNVDTHTVITKHKDGSITIVKDTHAHQDEHKVEHQVEIKYVDRIVEKKVEMWKEKTIKIDNRLDWRVGLLAGTNMGDILRGQLDLKSLSYGLEIDRRILGPFSLGIYGMTNKSVGLVLSGSF
ncbi:MAG: hypothetical protein NVS9B9_27670 [Ktedonobacteraceae bacterium]